MSYTWHMKTYHTPYSATTTTMTTTSQYRHQHFSSIRTDAPFVATIEQPPPPPLSCKKSIDFQHNQTILNVLCGSRCSAPSSMHPSLPPSATLLGLIWTIQILTVLGKSSAFAVIAYGLDRCTDRLDARKIHYTYYKSNSTKRPNYQIPYPPLRAIHWVSFHLSVTSNTR